MKKSTNKTIIILLGLILAVLIILSVSVLLSVFSEKPKGHFSDVNIVLFCGGDRDSRFSSVVYNGARDAAADLGCTVKYVWSDWDYHRMALQFKETAEEKPDGICMMGHPGYNALKSLVDEAVRKGIIVTFLNVDISELRKKYINSGMGYVGQELYNSGYMLGQGSIRKFNLKAGDEAIVFGIAFLPETGRGLRSKGCLDALTERGIKATLIPMTEVLNERAFSEDAKIMVRNVLKKYPETDLIIADHGDVTAAMEGILKSIGLAPGDIFVSGFDLSVETVEALKDGYVGLVHDQQPYLQGYLSVLQVCLSKTYGFSGLYIDTGVGLIDDTNIKFLEDWAKKQIR